MQHLVGDLLDMASIQAGRLTLERGTVELKPILVESCGSHQPLAHAKNLRLFGDWPIEGVTVFGDRVR